MNIRHVNRSIWTNMSIASYVSAIGLGIYGRNRINFSSDFTYNKYHFGMFCNLACGFGLMLSAKMVAPWQSGVFFVSALGNLSVPSVYEGMMDMRNEDIEGDSSLQRKIGLYSLLLAYAIIWKKY